MTFRSEVIVKKGRKIHSCGHCGGKIPKGDTSLRISGVWDGQFYAERGHIDCVDMWNDAYSTYGDPNDGMDFDLLEVLSADAGGEELEREMNAWRGKYPHVVCRLEFRIQRGHLAYADRCRNAGFEPDLKPYEQVFP